ncbi:MAG: 2-phospho-L-lactate guanylyltransferase [Pseudomonadota bacterium]
MKLCAAIPMKDPCEAKTRLGEALSNEARAGLARTLFRNTLRTVLQVEAFESVFVVTGSRDIRGLAEEFGTQVLSQQPSGLNLAANLAADAAVRQGYDGLAVIPGDLADPSVSDLVDLARLARPETVVIAPAHDGGTNALLVCPPKGLAFRYGAASSHAHQKAAHRAGLGCTLAVKQSLLHDIDTSDDLDRLARYGPISVLGDLSG